MSRLRYRRPFVIEAARLASLNQTEQDIWEQSKVDVLPPGHDPVTNKTCPQPELSVHHSESSKMWPTRCAESLDRWDLIASPACPCGESHHTTIGTLLKSARSLHSLRPATSPRSGYRRSGMVIETVYGTVRVYQTNNTTWTTDKATVFNLTTSLRCSQTCQPSRFWRDSPALLPDVPRPAKSGNVPLFVRSRIFLRNAARCPDVNANHPIERNYGNSVRFLTKIPNGTAAESPCYSVFWNEIDFCRLYSAYF